MVNLVYQGADFLLSQPSPMKVFYWWCINIFIAFNIKKSSKSLKPDQLLKCFKSLTNTKHVANSINNEERFICRLSKDYKYSIKNLLSQKTKFIKGKLWTYFLTYVKVTAFLHYTTYVHFVFILAWAPTSWTVLRWRLPYSLSTRHQKRTPSWEAS